MTSRVSELPVSADGLPVSADGLPVGVDGLPVGVDGLRVSVDERPAARAELGLTDGESP